jgi:hypothetical protein
VSASSPISRGISSKLTEGAQTPQISVSSKEPLGLSRELAGVEHSPVIATPSLAQDDSNDDALEERDRPPCVDENEMLLDVERMLDLEELDPFV